MNALTNINKYINHSVVWSDKESRCFYRHLLNRLMDVDHLFPNVIPQLGYIDIYFREFFSEDCDYTFTLKDGAEFYRLDVGDGFDCKKFRFPKCVLDDDWEGKLFKCIENKHRNDLQREIMKLEESIKNGPAELERLKKELADMDNV